MSLLLRIHHLLSLQTSSLIIDLLFFSSSRHHVPDVRIFLVPKLHYQKESIVTLMLVNPLEKPTNIRLEAMPAGEEAMEVDGEDKTATAKVRMCAL